MPGKYRSLQSFYIRTSDPGEFWQRIVAVSVVLSMVCLLFTGSTGVAFAQETINNASASGQVLDQSGSAVPAASVVALQTETNQSNTALTDQDGRFRFPILRPGPYEITVRASGFADSKRTAVLTVGSAFELKTVLSVKSGGTEVSVTADTEIIETARTQIAGTVLQDEIENLSLSGRSFLEAALLVPGVSPTNTGSNQLFAETSAVPGQGISMNSQRNFSNSVIVDGLSANDDAAGLTGSFYGLDSLAEFQVVTNGGQAEYGRALGGYMNMVTRSGTNDIHGTMYGFFRHDSMNASNPISSTTLPMTMAQYGASLGGPLVKNKTFYFGNFEQKMLNQTGLATISQANVDTINNRLLAVNYPGPLISTGIYPNPVHMTMVLGKVDHRFSDRDQFSVRYNMYNVTSSNSRGAGGLSAPTGSAGLDNRDHTIAISNIFTISPRMVNETRMQFINSDLKALPTDQIGPAVNIAGVATFGTFSNSPQGRLNNLFELADNLSYQMSAHSIRVGVDYLYNKDKITFPSSYRGSYAFSSLASFLSGTYNNAGFTQSFNNYIVEQGNPNFGVYLQDVWKATRNLTFNFGIRYDLQYLETINTDKNNVSPRAGFAWTPVSSTVVRGSFGLFYDRVPLRAVANVLLSAKNTTDPANLTRINVSLSPTQAGAPVFPNILSSLTLPPGVLFNLTTINPNMRNAYSEQGSLEIERQLGRNKTVSVGYQHVRGLHLMGSINQNVPTCVPVGTNNGCRPNPTYANNSQYSSAMDSVYDGLHISFQQRPAQWGSYRVSYTFSKSFNNVGEAFFSSPVDNYDVWKDYARSDDDQRHRLVVNGTVHTPLGAANNLFEKISHGFELSGIVQSYSAVPFNITSGVNTIQGTAGRPIVDGQFISRNAGIGFDYFNINAKLSRDFRMSDRWRMEARLEAFNLFNHVNGVSRNAVFGAGAYPTNPSSAFNTTTAVSDSRQLQIGLRLSF